MTRSGALVVVAAVLALASSGSSWGGSSSEGGSWTAIAASSGYTCALTNAGGVSCWGNNTSGQLGDGTKTEHLTPVAVSGLSTGVQAIAAHGGHTCALETGGGVECWGDNYYGPLGDGTTTDRPRPVAVSGLSSGVQAIAAGEDHTCSLLDDGTVECWGSNKYGQLGDGTADDRHTPVHVEDLSSPVQAISTGEIDTCALTRANGVECWGADPLGDGTPGGDFRAFPVPVSGLPSGVRAIAVGGTQTCALTTAGGVKCWGYNEDGEVGDGTTVNRLKPVAVSGLSSGVRAIAAGESHTCALMTDGNVKCWGWNAFGQLGDGTTTTRSTPVTVHGLAGVQAISAGGDHTCALLSDGEFKCWGSNLYGQLGNGTHTNALTVYVHGQGTVSGHGFRCTDRCDLEYPPGTRIVLTAQAAHGWALKSRSGACKGRAKRCAIVLKADAIATARFAKRR